MKIFIYQDYQKLSKAAGAFINGQILLKPDSVLGLATGGTPEGAYAEIVKSYNDNIINFQKVKTFNLDEYIGLDKEHEQSYYCFMNKHLFSKVNIAQDAFHLPDGMAKDLNAECRAYEEAIIQAGGIDLQLLGIGMNGHVGFNEPSKGFPVHTHVVSLTPSTIEANSRYFASSDLVPKSALTMGIGTIMKARKILLVASGDNKADTVERLISGTVEPEFPASCLKLHSDATVMLDKDAAKKILG